MLTRRGTGFAETQRSYRAFRELLAAIVGRKAEETETILTVFEFRHERAFALGAHK